MPRKQLSHMNVRKPAAASKAAAPIMNVAALKILMEPEKPDL
ncbi:MAG: hypothetical protein R6U51_09665 [Anaerolineales bacterium]